MVDLINEKVAVKIKESGESRSSLIESVSGQKVPQFAILNENLQQIGPWVNCKDYVQDSIYGTLKCDEVEIYGFKYNPAHCGRVSFKSLNLAIRHKDANLALYSNNLRQYLPKIEKRLGISKPERSRVSVPIPNKYFVVFGSKYWMMAPHTVSFFTFLCRILLKAPNEDLSQIKSVAHSSDAYYKKHATKYLNWLIKTGIKNIRFDWIGNNISAIHNGGFVNYSIGKIR